MRRRAWIAPRRQPRRRARGCAGSGARGGRTWEAAAPLVAPRNLAIARAYVQTDEPIRALGRRYGLADTRVAAIARNVVYRTLGRRLPGR